MKHTFSYSTDNILEEIDKFIRLQNERTEQTIAEIITTFDFIVGSNECKYRLMEVLPEGANIICSPYLASPTTIYVIKRFDIMGLLTEAHKEESEDKK